MTAPQGLPLPALAGSGLDRAAEERSTSNIVETARGLAQTRVLVVHGDRAPLHSADTLHWLSPTDVPDGAEWALLGREADGAFVLGAVFAQSETSCSPHPLDGRRCAASAVRWTNTTPRRSSRR